MTSKPALSFFFTFLFTACVFSQIARGNEDGTYDATVTTDSGSYTVPVEVEGNEVSYVHWPNGGDMHVYGGEIENGEAAGYNSRGESIEVELDDYNNQEEREE